MKILLSILLTCFSFYTFATQVPPKTWVADHRECLNEKEQIKLFLMEAEFQKHQANTWLNLDTDFYVAIQGNWKRCTLSYDEENVQILFPAKFQKKCKSKLKYAFSSDEYGNFYWFSGHSPSWKIQHTQLFDYIIKRANNYPYTLLDHKIFQLDNGHWILDYTQYDCETQETRNHRKIVTPFNVYWISCDVKEGKKDHYVAFRNSLEIQLK